MKEVLECTKRRNIIFTYASFLLVISQTNDKTDSGSNLCSDPHHLASRSIEGPPKPRTSSSGINHRSDQTQCFSINTRRVRSESSAVVNRTKSCDKLKQTQDPAIVAQVGLARNVADLKPRQNSTGSQRRWLSEISVNTLLGRADFDSRSSLKENSEHGEVYRHKLSAKTSTDNTISLRTTRSKTSLSTTTSSIPSNLISRSSNSNIAQSRSPTTHYSPFLNPGSRPTTPPNSDSDSDQDNFNFNPNNYTTSSTSNHMRTHISHHSRLKAVEMASNHHHPDSEDSGTDSGELHNNNDDPFCSIAERNKKWWLVAQNRLTVGEALVVLGGQMENIN